MVWLHCFMVVKDDGSISWTEVEVVRGALVGGAREEAMSDQDRDLRKSACMGQGESQRS